MEETDTTEPTGILLKNLTTSDMCPRGGRSDWKEIIAVQLNYAGVTLLL
jgi:hypothetical protein